MIAVLLLGGGAAGLGSVPAQAAPRIRPALPASAGAAPEGATIERFAGIGRSGIPTGPGAATSTPLGETLGEVAFDSAGNLYIADVYNHVVEKVTPSGVLSIFAGNGSTGYLAAGPATSRALGYPRGLTIDSADNVYVATDYGIAKIGPSSNLTLFNEDPASSLTVDSAGNIYAAEYRQIVKFTPGGARSVYAGNLNGGTPTTGDATSARVNPSSIKADSAGNVYVADSSNCVLEKIDTSPTPQISIIAGITGSCQSPTPGPASASTLNRPSKIGIDSADNVYVFGSCRISRISGGTLAVVAGASDQCGTPAYGSAALDSSVGYVTGLAFSQTDILYTSTSASVDRYPPAGVGAPGNFVATPGNRKIFLSFTAPSGTATGYQYSTDGGRAWTAFTPAGIGPYTYVLTGLGDGTNYSVRVRAINGGTKGLSTPTVRVTPTTWTIDRFAGRSGSAGQPTETAATDTSFVSPAGMAFDPAGNAYLADTGANRVLKIDRTGAQTFFAGDGNTGAATETARLSTHVWAPEGVATDSSGNVYVATSGDHRVLRIDAAGQVHFFAGTGQSGTPAAGRATDSPLAGPGALATDPSGNVYIADSRFVVKVDPGGALGIVAGTGDLAAPALGRASDSPIVPSGLAVDSIGNVYVSDATSDVVVKVTTDGTLGIPAGRSGAPGIPATGSSAYYSPLGDPTVLAVGNDDALYVNDTGSNQLLKITDERLTVVAGNGTGGASTYGRPSTLSAIGTGSALAVDPDGVLYFVDEANRTVDSFSFPVPSAPGLAAVAGSNQATLTITPPRRSTGGRIRGYEVSGGRYSGGWGPLVTRPGPNGTLMATMTSLGNGYSSALRVRAVNLAGKGVSSRPAVVAPSDVGLVRFAGTGNPGAPNPGPAASSALNDPRQIAFGPDGTLYVADFGNNRIEQITAAGRLSVLAGTGQVGRLSGTLPSGSPVEGPKGLAVDEVGNVFFTTVNGEIGQVRTNGVLSVVNTGVTLSDATSLAVDSTGALSVADYGASLVYQLEKGESQATILAGGGTGTPANGSIPTDVALHPYGLAIDATDVLYIADYDGHAIETVSAAGDQLNVALGTPSTAGTTMNDWGPSFLNRPTAVLPTENGLYVANSGDSTILRSRNQIVAGNRVAGAPSYGVPSTESRLQRVDALAVNSDGVVYLSQRGNHTVDRLGRLPDAPEMLNVVAGDGSVTLTFRAPWAGPGVGITGYQASVDSGGTWQPVAPAGPDSDGVLSVVLSSLVNGQKYGVTVRAISGAGPGAASSPRSVQPGGPDPPTGVRLTSGVASLMAGWDPVDGATSYQVTADPGPATCTVPAPGPTRCLLGANDSAEYVVRVVARSADGSSSASVPSNSAQPRSLPVPPTPDSAPATLTTDNGPIGTAVPGQRITLKGDGYAPYSWVRILLYSTPVDVGSVQTDSDGAFSLAVTLPGALDAGGHTLLASGADAGGQSRTQALPVTVSTNGGSGGSLPPPRGGQSILLDAQGNPATAVTIPGQGTYTIDTSTGRITFVPVAGFVGIADPVTYRITDALGTVTTGTYRAIVDGSSVALSGRLVLAALPRAVCGLRYGVIARCELRLTGTVNGRVLNLGRGVYQAGPTPELSSVNVTLNIGAKGKQAAARLGGLPVTVTALVRPADGTPELRARASTTLLAPRIRPPRPVFFRPGSATLGASELSYLRAVRQKLAGAKAIACVANTEPVGRHRADLALGRRRALAVCTFLNAGRRAPVRVTSRAAPRTGNAYGRRVDLALIY